MLDMRHFTLTKHDDELYAIIKPVKQYSAEHKLLARWAIDCLDRILPVFYLKYPEDVVLETAIMTLRKWIDGELRMWDARKYTYTVLALAKEMEKEDRPYSQIVRSASHCLATCHVPTHAEGSAMYVISAIKQINAERADVIALMENERRRQIERLKELIQLPEATPRRE